MFGRRQQPGRQDPHSQVGGFKLVSLPMLSSAQWFKLAVLCFLVFVLVTGNIKDLHLKPLWVLGKVSQIANSSEKFVQVKSKFHGSRFISVIQNVTPSMGVLRNWERQIEVPFTGILTLLISGAE